MPWDNSPEKRARDARVYQDPEYLRNKAIVLRNASGKCDQCGRRDRRIQVDHVKPVSQGGTHHLDNLRALCSGPGSCHARKTAQEGKGYRKPGSSPRHGKTEPDPPLQGRTQW